MSRKTTKTTRPEMPRFAPVYRDPSSCSNLRFSRDGDCASFDVCKGWSGCECGGHRGHFCRAAYYMDPCPVVATKTVSL